MAAALNQSEANNSVATVSPEQPPTIINDSIDCEDSLNSSKIDPVVDVSFLTEKEKTQILKVIKVDLELRRTALEDVKKDIEARKQIQLAQQSGQNCYEDSRGKCACCGQVFRTFCDRKNAIQCQQCQQTVCKLCKREQGGSVSCVLCIKEKLYNLQRVDYLPLFQMSPDVSADSAEKSTYEDTDAPYPLYGSDLLKKSLENSRRRVTFSLEHSNDSTRSSSLTSESKDLPHSFSTDSTKELKNTSPHMFSIDNPDCGFKLVKQEKTILETMLDLCSLYSEPCEPEDYEIQGEIQLGVWFRISEKTLFVRVIEARDLSAANDDGTSDPYVKVYLLPGKAKKMKRRTGIQRSTLNPKFNEMLKYGGLDTSEIRSKVLSVSVWDWDRFGRNHFLGEVRLPLSSMDLTDSSDKWYKLQNMKEKDKVSSSEIKGRLLLSLMFEPSPKVKSKNKDGETKGKLRILMTKAEDLKPADMSAQINPFARCYLLPNRLVDSKKKSKVVRDTLNPVWNSEIIYPRVSLEDLESSRVLEVTIWDQDRRGVNEFIGGIRLGPNPLVSSDKEWMDSTADEASHWEAALARPGEWVEQWHNLRPSMNSLNPNALRQPRRVVKQERVTSITSITSAASVTSIASSFASMSEDSITSLDSSPVINTATLSSLAKYMKRPPKGSHYNISGEVFLTVEYKEETLLVHIDRAVKIAAANRNGSSDSYVKIFLLPDQSKHSQKKTEVQKKTIDPIYNTTFKFKKVTFDKLSTRTLWLTVWDSRKVGSHLFLGEACIPLSILDLSNSSKKFCSCRLLDFTVTGVLASVEIVSDDFSVQQTLIQNQETETDFEQNGDQTETKELEKDDQDILLTSTDH